MTDLYFVHDLSIAIDFGSAIEMRAGEILENIPADLAGRLLQGSFVRPVEPGLDARKFSFDDPRRHEPGKARQIAPAIDPIKWAADEELAEKSKAAMAAQRHKAAARIAKERNGVSKSEGG